MTNRNVEPTFSCAVRRLRKRCVLTLMVLCILTSGEQVFAANDVPAQKAAGIATGAWFAAHGGKLHFGDPGRPAVLLVHGLNQDSRCWTHPSSMMSSVPVAGTVHFVYDFRHNPKEEHPGHKSSPGIGIYKVGNSDQLEVDQHNWFDFLVSRGFTVAVFTQPCCTFDQAYPTLVEAVNELALQSTLAMRLQAGAAGAPAIALVGHSRGGLLIRKLLKEKGDLNGRIRWVITLHSPHHGSEMGRAVAQLGAEVVDLMDTQVPASIDVFGKHISVTGSLKNELKNLAVEVFRPLNKALFLSYSDRELAPDAPLLRTLENGEKKVSKVQYYTFGGVAPTYVRLYFFVFDPNSAVPQTTVHTQGIKSSIETYFDWHAKPVEVPVVSPLFDKVRNFVPEIAPGKGDGLVTDASARLPFSIHETDQLNHVEVMWSGQLQQKVAMILSAPPAP